MTKPTLDEQQKLNFELCAELTRFIRAREPNGVTISVGGEIGEVGQKNSSPEDLEAFMKGYDALRGPVTGISKISVQTGTSHGGVVLPDGTLAQVAIDFDVLKELSEQPAANTAWAGLSSTGRARFPTPPSISSSSPAPARSTWPRPSSRSSWTTRPPRRALRREISEWLKVNAAGERKPKDTEAQFLYKTRKKAVGPFKKQFWTLPEAALAAIGASLREAVRIPLRTAGDRRDDRHRGEAYQGSRDPSAPARGRHQDPSRRSRRRGWRTESSHSSLLPDFVLSPMANKEKT